MSDKVLTLGLIGAGAIARHAYFPVFKDIPELRLTAVVEPNEKIRQSLQDIDSLNYLGDDIKAAIDHVDAVIICVPNYLHYNIAKFCLEEGKHVLCEKPVCVNLTDAENLVETAKRNSLVFTAAHVRRYYPAINKIKEIVSNRTLGVLKRFDFSEGTIFGWQTVTGYLFDKKQSGGGVLMDIGIHLLDTLFWWIDGEVSSIQYVDDNLGGVEATGEIEMIFANGISGHVKLTRINVLKNFYTLYFENGIVSWNPFFPQRIYTTKGNKKPIVLTMKRINPVKNLLQDFASSINNNKEPFIQGEEAVTILKFIHRCYASRTLLSMPWIEAKVRP